MSASSPFTNGQVAKAMEQVAQYLNTLLSLRNALGALMGVRALTAPLDPLGGALVIIERLKVHYKSLPPDDGSNL